MSAGLAARHAGDAGEGVLWIHGYTLDSRIWAELWDALPGFRHIGVDLPGHGASRPFRRGEDLAGLAGELHDLTAREGARHVVALSFGTTVALELAIRHPTAFATLTLAAPAPAGTPPDPLAARRYAELFRLYRERGAGPHMTELWTRPAPDIFLHARRDRERWPRLEAIVGAHRWSELGDGAMLGLTRGGAHGPAALGQVGARTLVLTGEHELPGFRVAAETLGRQIPACTLAQIPGAGHLCLIEAPEPAAALLAAHLR